MNNRSFPTPLPTRRRYRQRGGTILALTLILLFILLLMGAAYLALANTSSLMANRGAYKAQADSLAEAAVYKHYDVIRNYMSQNQAWDASSLATLSSTALTSNDGQSRNDGSFSSVATVPTPTTTTDTTNNIQTTVYTIYLNGSGTAINTGRTGSHLHAAFTVTQIAPLASVTQLSAFDATSVIQSNTGITLNTNQGFRTHSSGDSYDGSILANTGVTWTPSQGKTNITNPNVLTIDGPVFVGSASAATSTASTSGMGNPNGTKNYQSNAATAQNGHPAATANSITNMGAPHVYPDATAVGAWQSTWVTQSQTGTKYSSSIDANSAPYVNGQRTITAPAYINGDLNINSGQQLYIEPSSDTSKPNVIYVTGSINNSALLYNGGVVLVAVGKYTDQNSSAQYQLATQNSPYTTTKNGLTPIQQIENKAALVALSPTSTAINLGTNTSNITGLVYAALGGIVAQANNNFSGVLVAGGNAPDGGVAAGNGNSFDITMTPLAIQGRSDFMFTPGGTTSTGTPGQITSTTISALSQFVWAPR